MAWKRCWEKQEEWKPSPPSFPPPSWMTRKGCWEEQEEWKPRPPSFPPPSWMTRKRCWEEQEELKPRPPSFPPPSWEEHDKEEEFEYVFEEEWWPEKPPPVVAVPPPPPPIPLQLPLPLPPPPPPVLKQDEVDDVDVLVEAIDGSDDEWHSDGRVNISKYWQEAWQQQHPNLPVPPPPKPVTVVPDWSDLCKAAAEPETEPDIRRQKLVLDKAEVATQTDGDDAGGFEKKEKDLSVEKEKEKVQLLDDLNPGVPGDVATQTQTDDAGGFEKKEKDLRVEKEKEKVQLLDDLNPGDVATQTGDAGELKKKEKEKFHFLDLRVEKQKEKEKVHFDDLNPGDASACDAISHDAGGFERVKVGFGQGSTSKSSMRPKPLPPYNKPRKRIAKHVPPPVRCEVTKETATPKPSLSKELSLAVAQPKSLAVKRDPGFASKRHSWMS